MTKSTTAETAVPSARARWVAMVVLLVASFMNLIDVTIVNVALPSIEADLGATSAQIEWVVAVYIVVFALCLIPGGRMGDMLGRRSVFIAGVMVFTIGSALCGLAPSIGTLVGARAIQGIGGAIMIPQTLALVPALFPPAERGAAFALFGLSAGLASVSGPLLGGGADRHRSMGAGVATDFPRQHSRRGVGGASGAAVSASGCAPPQCGG
jgi:MFS family permease